MIAAALLLIGVVIFVNNPGAIGAFLASTQEIGHGPEETTRGLLAAGFCGVVLVAVVKLLTNNGRSNQ